MRSFVSIICLMVLCWFAVPLNAQHRQITQAEYFWNADPGNGQGTPLQAVDGSFNQALEAAFANTANLPAAGKHRIGIRVRAANGSWGPVFYQMVEVLGSNTITPDFKITAAEYFWGNDPGLGNGTSLLAINGNFSEALETAMGTISVPSVGFHKLSIRMQDAAGYWGPAFGTVVEVTNAPVFIASIKVTAAECFWGNDPGLGNGTPLLAINGNFSEALETALGTMAVPSAGFHKLSIRMQDAAGNWGPAFGSVVEITNAPVFTASFKITAAECFWGNDPGLGNGTPLLAINGNFSEALETALGTITVPSAGFHKLSIRMQDAAGHWGPAFSAVVEVTNAPVFIASFNITAAEFFWNTDPGTGNGTPLLAINGNFSAALERAIATSATPGVGTHQLYVRVKDNHTWGPSFGTVIEVLPNTTTILPNIRIAAAEYYFDNDPGPGNATPMLAFDGNFNSAMERIKGGNIPAPVSAGYHTLYMRVQDAASNWGPAYGVVVNIDTTIAFVSQINGPTQLCASALAGVAYSAPAIFGNTYQWSISDGTIANGMGTRNITVDWNATGTHQLQLVECNANGTLCDTTSLAPTVKPSFVANISQTICQGQSYLGYTLSGTYRDTLLAANGCDSIRVLTLTVTPMASTSITMAICPGQQYHGYAASGTYVDTFATASGCDSTRTLILSVLPSSNTIVNETICQGGTYHGYTASGTYIDTFTNPSGCDSIRTLLLTVLPSFNATVSKTICQGATYHGYASSGTYVDTFAHPSGCDSIRTLILTVLPLNATISKTLCYGTTYNGYAATGTYIDTLVSSAGCDSIRLLYLTVLHQITDTVSATICQGQSYEGYTAAGTYMDTLSALSGCDSIRTLYLTVLPSAHSTLTATVCHGDVFAGYTATGTYRDTFVAANGCDSIRTINLTVLGANITTLHQSICPGGSFLGYTHTGTYRDTLTAANGCDSIRILHLTMKAVPQTSINQTVCFGGSYLGYTQTGIYRDTFVAANGCDSLRTLNLTVLGEITTSINVVACEGDVVEGYHATGEYTDTFTSAFGCDSIRTLNLTLLTQQFTSNKVRICHGDSILLGNHWHQGGSIITDTALNANGCFDINYTLVEFYTEVATPTITQSGETLTVTEVYEAYQWYFNGNAINGAIGHQVVANAPGTYMVVVFDGGCSATGAYELLPTGVSNLMPNWDVRYYPNPTNGILYLELLGAPEAKVMLYNNLGQLLYQGKLEGMQTVRVDMGMFAKGIYYLKTQIGEEVLTHKVSKVE